MYSFNRGDEVIYLPYGYKAKIYDFYTTSQSPFGIMEPCYTIILENGYRQVCRESDLRRYNPLGASGGACQNPASKQETKLEDKKVKKDMSIIEKFALSLKSEPEKTYRKTGITDSRDILTDEGQKIFLTWLLKKNDKFLEEVATPLLEEIEKDK